MSRRDEITPQMRVYDALQPVYLPFLGFFQPPHFASPIVNTDGRGFRQSTKHGKILAWSAPAQTYTVLLGGSTVFGVGASHDSKTLASRLNKSDNFWCLNFGGRAFSSFQELLLLLCHVGTLNIKNLIVVSGINDLYLYYAARNYLRGAGTLFFEETFRRAFFMAHFGRKQRIIKGLFERFFNLRHKGESINLDYLKFDDLVVLSRGERDLRGIADKAKNDLFVDVFDHARQDFLLEEVMTNHIANLSALCSGMQIKLYYFLQPLANWVDKELSWEEKMLFSELDRAQSGAWKIFKEKIGKEKHEWYASLLSRACAAKDIFFRDTNKWFSRPEYAGKWLFVDRVHLTDFGYDLLSRFVHEEMSLCCRTF